MQLVIRHRRDLVRKGAALNCQIRDHLEAALPGFAACFDKLWERLFLGIYSVAFPRPNNSATPD